MLSEEDIETFRRMWAKGFRWPYLEKRFGLTKYYLKGIAVENDFEPKIKPRPKSNSTYLTTLEKKVVEGTIAGMRRFGIIRTLDPKAKDLRRVDNADD